MVFKIGTSVHKFSIKNYKISYELVKDKVNNPQLYSDKYGNNFVSHNGETFDNGDVEFWSSTVAKYGKGINGLMYQYTLNYTTNCYKLKNFDAEGSLVDSSYNGVKVNDLYFVNDNEYY